MWGNEVPKGGKDFVEKWATGCLWYFTKSLAKFFLYLDNISEVGVKGNGLVYLLEEIHERKGIQTGAEKAITVKQI